MVDVINKAGVRKEAENVNVGSDFYNRLDEEVKRMIKRSIARADKNGRKTIKARDV